MDSEIQYLRLGLFGEIQGCGISLLMLLIASNRGHYANLINKLEDLLPQKRYPKAQFQIWLAQWINISPVTLVGTVFPFVLGPVQYLDSCPQPTQLMNGSLLQQLCIRFLGLSGLNNSTVLSQPGSQKSEIKVLSRQSLSEGCEGESAPGLSPSFW